MKKYIFSLLPALILSTLVVGQSASEKKYFKDPVEDTVKNESVVIVRDYDEYNISKFSAFDYKVNIVSRTQYKLKDVYAIEAFNTITKSSGLKKIIITQLKPDGTLKEIYIKEDKNYKDDQSYDDVKFKEGEDKIAVEDLEIGDIIDYRYEWSYTTAVKPQNTVDVKHSKYMQIEASVKNYNIFRKLPEFTKFLQERYPSLSACYIMDVPEEINLLQKAVNCNYKFIETTGGGRRVFRCDIGYVKAYKGEQFSYSYIDLPVLKYCLIQTKNETMDNLYPFQFNDGSITDDQVAELGRNFYANKKFMPKYLYYTDAKKYTLGYEEVSLNAFFTAFIKTFKGENKLEVLNKFHEYLSNNDEINQWQFSKMNFAVLMARFCDKIKQPYQMIACLHKYEGKWDEIIYPGDISWGIFIENGDKDLYITSTSKTSNIYSMFGSLDGTDIVVFNPKDKMPPTVRKYPDVGYGDNTVNYVSEVELTDEATLEYHFINNYTFKGLMIDNINDNIAYRFYPEELDTDAGFWGLVNYGLYNDEIYRDSGDYMPEFRRINASFGERREESTKESFEYFLYSEYHFDDIKVDSFRIIEGAGYADGPEAECKFKVEFNSESVVEKTNNDYLVMNLGKLITEQMEISNFKRNERMTNVYNSNLKEITWDITVDLPKGYKPVNLNDFICDFKNEAGIFKATIVQVGDQLQIKVTKIYTSHYLPKDKWSEMVTFLKQAVLFYEKKLLLEKK
ncbi:MAG: hypothetical protein V4613_04920 [Bacteroidota bacterium]